MIFLLLLVLELVKRMVLAGGGDAGMKGFESGRVPVGGSVILVFYPVNLGLVVGQGLGLGGMEMVC